MAQFGGRIPILSADGYAVVSPVADAWKKLSDIVPIPAECTGAILQAIDQPLYWMESPSAIPDYPGGLRLSAKYYMTLSGFDQVSQLCINTDEEPHFAVQFYTGPIGALPIITTMYSGSGSGGGSVNSVLGEYPIISTGGTDPLIYVSPNGLSRTQLMNLISDNGLIPGWEYLLLDATVSNPQRIVVKAASTNALFPQVTTNAQAYDRAFYNIVTNVLECYDDISCVVESNGTDWVLRGEPAFLPRGVNTVTPAGGLSFSVNYLRTDYTHVISSLLSGSRSLCLDQWALGTSNGLGSVSCIVSNRLIWTELAGPSFMIPPTSPAVQNAVWSSSLNGLLLTVDTADSYGPISAASQSEVYRCIATNINTSTILVQFVDKTGAIATTPDSDMKFSLQRNAPMILDAQKFYSRATQPTKAWVSVRVTMMKRIS